MHLTIKALRLDSTALQTSRPPASFAASAPARAWPALQSHIVTLQVGAGACRCREGLVIPLLCKPLGPLPPLEQSCRQRLADCQHFCHADTLPVQDIGAAGSCQCRGAAACRGRLLTRATGLLGGRHFLSHFAVHDLHSLPDTLSCKPGLRARGPFKQRRGKRNNVVKC